MRDRRKINIPVIILGIILGITGCYLIMIGTTVTVQGEEGEHFSFLPIIRNSGEAIEPTPTPDTCSDPEADIYPHEPDGSNWYPEVEGEERVVNIWFPGHPVYSSTHKLRLYPEDNVGLINGGGDSSSWPVGCREVADENLVNNPNDLVELADLVDAGLVYDPTETTPTPEPSATLTPTIQPTATATQVPPTNTPTATPTNTPTLTPTPELCNEPVMTDTLDPSSWQYPGYGYMTITNTFQIAGQFWTNLPNRSQELFKYRRYPSDPVVSIVGGGYVEYWDASCETQVDARYDSWSLQVADFDALNVMLDPQTCQSPTVGTRDPEVGVPWDLGGDTQIVVGQLWTNEPGQNQDEFKTLLHPFEIPWPVLAGGTSWTFNAGCGVEAQAQLDIIEVPMCDIACLDSRGLLAWP